ncbi:MAG: hypothetical protein QOD92_3648 [Acidimicrobiaceae bacterium]
MTSFPVPTFEVGFDSDPLDAQVYTDLSARLSRVSYGYGKKPGSGEFSPGSMLSTLDNHDRVLDKLNAAGTYYGKLNPRKRDRLKLTVGGVTYDQFTGFTDGFPQSGFTPTTSVIELTSTDVEIILGGIDLPANVWMLEASADPTFIWYRLNETSGQVVADSSGNGRDAALQYTRVDNLDNVGLPAVAVGEPMIAFDDAATLALDAAAVSTSVAAPIATLTDLPTDLPITIEAWVSHDVGADALSDQIVDAEFNGLHLACWLDGDGAGLTTFSAGCLWWKSASGYRNDFVAPTPSAEFTERPRHVVFLFDTTGNSIYVDGVSVGIASVAYAGASVPKTFLTVGHVRPNDGSENTFYCGRLGDVRVYDSLLSPTRIAAHADAGLTPWNGDTTGERIQRVLDYCGVLAADASIDTGTITLGPTALGGDGLAYMKQIALTEAGDLFVEHRNAGKLTFRDCYSALTASRSTTPQAVFTDDPAAAPGAYRFEPDGLVLTDDESQVVNEAIVKWDQGEARHLDATSKAAHGLKSKTVDTKLKSQQEAQSLAEWIVDHHKDSFTRVESITLNPGADQTLWPAALGLRYGDRVTFRFKPQNIGTAIQTDYLVQGSDVDIDFADRKCRVTFYLSPVEIQRNYAVWGTGLWGTATWGK